MHFLARLSLRCWVRVFLREELTLRGRTGAAWGSLAQLRSPALPQTPYTRCHCVSSLVRYASRFAHIGSSDDDSLDESSDDETVASLARGAVARRRRCSAAVARRDEQRHAVCPGGMFSASRVGPWTREYRRSGDCSKRAALPSSHEHEISGLPQTMPVPLALEPVGGQPRRPLLAGVRVEMEPRRPGGRPPVFATWFAFTGAGQRGALVVKTVGCVIKGQ